MIFKPQLIDRRTVYRQASRELPHISTLTGCFCTRQHSTHHELITCAMPTATALSQVTGEFLVTQHCGATPTFSMFKSFGEASRAFDSQNVWGCNTLSGCKGFHEIRLVVL